MLVKSLQFSITRLSFLQLDEPHGERVWPRADPCISKNHSVQVHDTETSPLLLPRRIGGSRISANQIALMAAAELKSDLSTTEMRSLLGGGGRTATDTANPILRGRGRILPDELGCGSQKRIEKVCCRLK